MIVFWASPNQKKGAILGEIGTDGLVGLFEKGVKWEVSKAELAFWRGRSCSDFRTVVSFAAFGDNERCLG